MHGATVAATDRRNCCCQGRPNAPSAMQNGDKNKEVRGTKFKIVATRCHILRLECTKFNFGWGSAPDPAGGAHSAPPDPVTGFEGVLLLRKGMGWEGREGKGEGEEKEERGKGGKGEVLGRGKEGKGRGCVMAFGGTDAPGCSSRRGAILPLCQGVHS